MEWRKPLSIVLLVLVLFTVLTNRARKYGLVISHIYAIIVGLLSYATFTAYLQNLGPEVFYKNVLLAIGAFIAFGLIGYFIVDNASGMGEYLFLTLVALIVAGIICFFFHIAIIVGLLFYATFIAYLQNLGPEVFYKNVLLAIGAFIAFGLIGYFIVDNASGMGKYLFVTLVALIVAGIIGMFVHNPIFHTIIT